MVRSKHARLGNTKRNRDSVQEERINARLRDFEILAVSLQASLESSMLEQMDELSRMFQMEKERMPKRILKLRMGDLRLLGIASFADLDKLATENCDSNCSSRTSDFSQSSLHVGKEKTDTKRSTKADEGYLTEDSAMSNLCSESSTRSRPYGPLASAMKNRRRSKSVSANATPSKIVNRSMLLGLRPKRTVGPCQNLLSDVDRRSRPTFRTPGPENHRLQTVSADRGMSLITPKVQPNTPLAILRHARIGESIYSMTGSPVITSAMIEGTANVNIPVANGILSIRPTEMECVDPELLQKIDHNTLKHLKLLQSNLDKLMQVAEEQNFQRK